jgi:solute carrier family 8 (sodium/calcium exchanger)
MDALQLEESSYPAQFVEAMNVNGGDLKGATVLDYIMHFLTFFWKVCIYYIQDNNQ